MLLCYCPRLLKKKDGDLFRINGFLISMYNSSTDICLWLWFALVNKVFNNVFRFFVYLLDRISCGPGWPWTHYVLNSWSFCIYLPSAGDEAQWFVHAREVLNWTQVFALEENKIFIQEYTNHWDLSRNPETFVCLCVYHTHAHQESSPGPYTCQAISTTEP